MITVNKTLEELELLTIELTLDHVLTFNHALQMNKTISSVCLPSRNCTMDPRIKPSEKQVVSFKDDITN